MKKLEEPLIIFAKKISEAIPFSKYELQILFLNYDRYIQLVLLLVLVLLVYCDNDYRIIAFFSIAVWHIISFLIRLSLPYPKSSFFKFYGSYLIAFLVSFLSAILLPQNVVILVILCGLISPLIGIMFLINCFKDYRKISRIH